MSDDLERLDEHGLPAWVGRALRQPVAMDGAAKARLMGRVRAAADVRNHVGHRAPAAWRTRRGLAPFAGLAAAAVAGLTILGSAHGVVRPDSRGTLRDTLRATTVLAPVGDSPGSSLLRDTLRLVRFVLVAPNAMRLALAGDFNGWSRTATPMTSAEDARGVWTATLALAPGAHRYAFVVDDTRAVADPAAPAARDTSDGARSVLTVPAVRD